MRTLVLSLTVGTVLAAVLGLFVSGSPATLVANPLPDVCANATDDDGDTLVNDGCPASGPAESGAQCANATDDDSDTLVNDGCPASAVAEFCADLDGDGVVTEIDFDIVVTYFGQFVPPAPDQVDLNNSGTVTLSDISAAVGAFGTTTSCQTKPLVPQPELVSATIDAGGGTLDTGVLNSVEGELTIPSGALTGDTLVSIEASASTSAPSLDSFLGNSPPLIPDPLNLPVVQRIFDLGPNGQQLNPPATLELSYEQFGIPQGREDAIGVLHYIEAEDRWENLPIVSHNETANKIVVEVDSFSIYAIYEPVVDDTDSDGCLDVDEQQTAPGIQEFGGLRDPLTFWDFFQVPHILTVPGEYVTDDVINNRDFFEILRRYNAEDNGPGDFDRDDNPLLPPNPSIYPPQSPADYRANYHPAYDHTYAAAGADPWRNGPPDGAISGNDIFTFFNSEVPGFHVCTE